MKRLLILMMLLVSSNSFAASLGDFNCEVKFLRSFSMKDGVAENIGEVMFNRNYSPMNVRVGSLLNLSYSYTDANGGSVGIILTPTEKFDPIVIASYVPKNKTYDTIMLNDQYNNETLTFSKNTFSIDWGLNSINLKNTSDGRWIGFYTLNDHIRFKSSNVGLDCQHSKNGFDKLYEKTD